jgi:hypothetical protein
VELAAAVRANLATGKVCGHDLVKLIGHGFASGSDFKATRTLFTDLRR